MRMWHHNANKPLSRSLSLQDSAKFILVVAAALQDGEGRLLLAQRPEGRHRAGQWEFPGGKVEPGEDPRAALRREIAEELGITLDPQAMTPAGFAEEEEAGDAHPAILLLLYSCTAWHGQPEGRDGQAWAWRTPADAAELDLPPMDRALLRVFAR